MKKLMIFFAMAMICTLAMAQSETTRTIHGAVVDKNGNPLPGAVVSATNGAETALVNADGTFELEIPVWLKSVTASYAGYNSKKMKPEFNQDMIFRLSKKQPKYGFINAFGGFSFFEENSCPTYGLMGGLLANVGFYAKAGVTIYDDVVSGMIIGGATKRIYKNIYAYLGVGYCGVLYEDYVYGGASGLEDYNTVDQVPGIAFDGGFIFGIGRHFNVSVGYTHALDFSYYWNCIPNISLGYVF